MKKFFLLLVPLFLVYSCHSRQGVSLEEAGGKTFPLRYAEGFKVTDYPDYTIVDIRDPWNPQRNLQRYVLIDRNKETPVELPSGTLIRTPIQKVMVYTVVHCAVLDELGVADDIAGICEPRFIHAPAIRSRLADGMIADMGESASPNTEKMIELGVEVVLASPLHNTGYGAVEKTGIPIIECPDYMEATPLGRAEWLYFLGLLTGKSALADSLFHETETRYMDIKNKIAMVTHRPTLFTEKKYGDSWYVPAGDSFMAHLYRDAGADYIFSYLSGAGGTPLNFEIVLDKAIHADYWLFNYALDAEMSYQSLVAEYELYANFDAFKKHRVYGCNTDFSIFFEEVPMHPDFLLCELVAILHPELIPGYQLRYFHPLR